MHNLFHGVRRRIGKQLGKLRFFTQTPKNALRWDQIIWLAVIGLSFWVIVENSDTAQNMANQVLTTITDSLIDILQIPGF